VIIKTLHLKNFRRFSQLDIDFHPQVTVIVARNGQGKTSVLDGITVALGTYVGAFDMGKAQHIEKSDAHLARLNQLPEGEAQYPVVVEAGFSGPGMTVRRELSGPKNKTTIRDAHEITDYGARLQAMVREGGLSPLPLVSYYGAGRLWKVHKNMERKQVISASRTMGYEDCLSPASNFVQCQQWMAKATFAHLQEQEEATAQPASVSMEDRLFAIQEAVNYVLAAEGWSEFRYSVLQEELTMFQPECGRLPVSMLSDGVRAMVSMVADIAFRCVRLNGYLGRRAARETQGIVLIDEVDIHLHPSWQQRVLRTLCDAFPKLQFIVTTHSPQVLTSVDAACIRKIESDVEETGELSVTKASRVSQQTKGVASVDLLAAIMGVDPIPDVPEAHWVSEFHALVQQNQYETEAAKDLRSQLEQHFGEDHPVLREIDRMIRLQVLKAGWPKAAREQS
jgi:predicted ATP-binding protein involved in virulence